jgi:hypothetical protein
MFSLQEQADYFNAIFITQCFKVRKELFQGLTSATILNIDKYRYIQTYFTRPPWKRQYRAQPTNKKILDRWKE